MTINDCNRAQLLERLGSEQLDVQNNWDDFIRVFSAYLEIKGVHSGSPVVGKPGTGMLPIHGDGNQPIGITIFFPLKDKDETSPGIEKMKRELVRDFDICCERGHELNDVRQEFGNKPKRRQPHDDMPVMQIMVDQLPRYELQISGPELAKLREAMDWVLKGREIGKNCGRGGDISKG